MSESQNDLRAALIRVLQNRNAGFDIVIAASEVIAADARFNRWVATAAKSESSNVDMLDLVERYGALVDESMSAWGRFLADENAEQLLASLQAIGSRLLEMTGR